MDIEERREQACLSPTGRQQRWCWQRHWYMHAPLHAELSLRGMVLVATQRGRLSAKSLPLLDHLDLPKIQRARETAELALRNQMLQGAKLRKEIGLML